MDTNGSDWFSAHKWAGLCLRHTFGAHRCALVQQMPLAEVPVASEKEGWRARGQRVRPVLSHYNEQIEENRQVYFSNIMNLASVSKHNFLLTN